MNKITILSFFIPFFLSCATQKPKHNFENKNAAEATLTSLNEIKKYVSALDTSKSFADLQNLSVKFEMIGRKEKNNWLPYYYSVLSSINAGYHLLNNKKDQIDDHCTKAEQLLSTADLLSPDNSEIYILKSMLASLGMLKDPATRSMEYGGRSRKAIETAKQFNPENPRVYLLEAQNKFFTPEQYGGSKAEAKNLFTKAIEKYESKKITDGISPNWGYDMAKQFLLSFQSGK